MDNVTHSLAGLVLAEATVQMRGRLTGEEPSPRFRTVAAVSSVIAANLPDADLLYTGVGGDRLAYMLHHRGYTHTVVAAIVGAVLVWSAAVFILRSRQDSPRRHDARWLFGLLLAGTMSHLLLDWTNSYGVHLFWPVDDRWQYGDAVFIVEPWFWVLTIPVLVAATRNRLARTLLAFVLVAGLALAWRVDLVTRGAAILLTSGAVLTIAGVRVLRPAARIAAAIAGWIAVTLAMAAGSATARAATLRAVHAADPAAEVLDVVVSPLPANAVCMAIITVERTGATYRVVTARVSSVPSIAVAAKCGARREAGAMFEHVSRQSTRAVEWDAQWTAPNAELAALARESCPVLAALRFIRVPIWRALDDSTIVLGDVRFGGAGSGFSTVSAPRRSGVCPSRVPPWVPPRSDLLSLEFAGGR